MVNRLSRALLRAGLRPGDAMAVIAPNCAEFVAAYLAGAQIGLQVVPVNWHLSEAELGFILNDSNARAIIAHADLGERVLGTTAKAAVGADLKLVIGRAEGFYPLADFLAPHSFAAVEGEGSGRMMAYTSATTGRPKAVVLPAGNAKHALERRVAASAHLGIRPEDGHVNLCASMLYHSAPLLGVELALHMGHRVVLIGRWEAERILALIERHRVTTTFLVPSMFVRLLKLPKAVRDKYSTASLQFVAHGAAPCPPDVKRKMIEWWGEIIWESYGATEVQGTVASAREWLRYPGTVGKPLPGAELRILDENGNELPPGRVGLIYLKPHTGDHFEYKGDPEKTRRAYRGDFICVGDLGFVNEEGYLFVCDRSSDLIISSGMNIYPAEIEGILIQHPAVVDCAVIGEPHALLGSVPKAVVQLEEGVLPGSSTKAELLAFLGGRISAAKLPKRIEFVERLPRDPSGKLFKRLLRAGRQE